MDKPGIPEVAIALSTSARVMPGLKGPREPSGPIRNRAWNGLVGVARGAEVGDPGVAAAVGDEIAGDGVVAEDAGDVACPDAATPPAAVAPDGEPPC